MTALSQTGAATYGAESPQAVVAGVQKAMAAKDLAATLRHVTPAGREATVKDLLGGTLVAMAMSDPDASVLSAMDKIAPIVGMPKPEPQPLFTFRAVTDYQMQGDRATAKAGSDTLEFERVQSRWYIKLPATSR